ncbi:transporter substrate-binding domain-containing protein [Vibrio sp. RE86]|uniref:GGDEF domain-containing protein n=1 Tax=Vibrio sp. RE86 TaxID=2607605 RepID=UPI0014934ED4|nr:GGDEF domain-containing protein [Vibrio sp. RE86]NOH79167.1 transporter substrate-binding domain-containing protein [Vibrio sp. RE86]
MAHFQRLLGLAVALLLSVSVQANTIYKVAMEEDDIVTRTLFDAVATEFDVTIHYVYYPSFNAILNGVKTGESDFAANVTYTEERAEYLDYSSPTNIEYTYLFSQNGTTLEEVETVGVPKGTIYGELVSRYYPDVRQLNYRGHAEAKELLQTGQVDGVIDAINQLKPMLLAGWDAQVLNHQVPILPVAIVVPKNKHSVFLKQIESFAHTAEVQKELRENVEAYQFELRQQALRKTVLESGIDLTRPYKVKFENIGQFAIYHENGEVTGISADAVMESCQILLLKCQVVSQADETWESMYQSLIDNQIDILAPVAILESRKALVNFSTPYYFPEVILIKREGYNDQVYRNVSELITEEIGVIKEDFFQNLLEQMLPNKAIKQYSNMESLLDALLDGDIDYTALSRQNYNQAIRNESRWVALAEDRSIGSFYQNQIAIGFAKTLEGERLAGLFSQALTMVDTERLIEQYDSRPNWKATLQAEKLYSQNSQILFVLAMTFLIIIAMYLHSQSNTDPLTRLKNRRALNQNYRNGVYSNDVLIYLDVNKFKIINDTHGHDVGDQVLIAVAKHIEKHWKKRGYRIGGDEFVLVGRIKEGRLATLLDSLSSVEFVSHDKKHQFVVSLAMGVSESRSRLMTLQEVLTDADHAMYRNKQAVKASIHEGSDDNVVHYL